MDHAPVPSSSQGRTQNDAAPALLSCGHASRAVISAPGERRSCCKTCASCALWLERALHCLWGGLLPFGRALLVQPSRQQPHTLLAGGEASSSCQASRNYGHLTLLCQAQGIKGLIRSDGKGGVGAVVQAVQVPGGVWVRGATISVFTDCGVLALEAATPAAFMLWCAPLGSCS